MNALKKGLIVAAGGITLAAFGLTGASAHEEEDFEFSGVANETCIGPNDTDWSVTWTIENDEGENPFGIVATTPFNVNFEPLVNDPAPGEYIPAGESASGTSVHPVTEESVTLTVEHDVTFDDNEFFDATVERPEDCDIDNSITITKVCPIGAGDASLSIAVGDDSEPFLCGESNTWDDLDTGVHTISESISGTDADNFATLIDCGATDATGTSLDVTLDFADDLDCVVYNIFVGDDLVDDEIDDVVDGLDFEFELEVEIKNILNNINDNKNISENVNVNENVNKNEQNQLSEQNTNVETGDVNVISEGGEGVGTGTAVAGDDDKHHGDKDHHDKKHDDKKHHGTGAHGDVKIKAPSTGSGGLR